MLLGYSPMTVIRNGIINLGIRIYQGTRDLLFPGSIVMPKENNIGIKIDVDDPVFGWRDITTYPLVLSPGANDPTLTSFIGNISLFAFSNVSMNQAYLQYHIPHDYKSGTDLYIHTHWSVNSAGATGDLKWLYEASYSKGHDQAAFTSPITCSGIQTVNGTQYFHQLIETQLSTSGGSSVMLDTDLIEPDGLIILRVYRSPSDPGDTLSTVAFQHYVDLHYQSTNISTRSKVPDFYS